MSSGSSRSAQAGVNAFMSCLRFSTSPCAEAVLVIVDETLEDLGSRRRRRYLRAPSDERPGARAREAPPPRVLRLQALALDDHAAGSTRRRSCSAPVTAVSSRLGGEHRSAVLQLGHDGVHLSPRCGGCRLLLSLGATVRRVFRRRVVSSKFSSASLRAIFSSRAAFSLRSRASRPSASPPSPRACRIDAWGAPERLHLEIRHR